MLQLISTKDLKIKTDFVEPDSEPISSFVFPEIDSDPDKVLTRRFHQFNFGITRSYFRLNYLSALSYGRLLFGFIIFHGNWAESL